MTIEIKRSNDQYYIDENEVEKKKAIQKIIQHLKNAAEFYQVSNAQYALARLYYNNSLISNMIQEMKRIPEFQCKCLYQYIKKYKDINYDNIDFLLTKYEYFGDDINDDVYKKCCYCIRDSFILDKTSNTTTDNSTKGIINILNNLNLNETSDSNEDSTFSLSTNNTNDTNSTSDINNANSTNNNTNNTTNDTNDTNNTNDTNCSNHNSTNSNDNNNNNSKYNNNTSNTTINTITNTTTTNTTNINTSNTNITTNYTSPNTSTFTITSNTTINNTTSNNTNENNATTSNSPTNNTTVNNATANNTAANNTMANNTTANNTISRNTTIIDATITSSTSTTFPTSTSLNPPISNHNRTLSRTLSRNSSRHRYRSSHNRNRSSRNNRNNNNRNRNRNNSDSIGSYMVNSHDYWRQCENICNCCSILKAFNEITSYKWCLRSAQQNNPLAQCMLGHFYKKGIKIILVNKSTNELIIDYILPKSMKDATTWYRRSAYNGNPEGQYYYGTCFEEGIGVPIDYRKATSWYKISGENGYGLASYNLGRCYKRGFGVPLDLDVALKWIKRSALQEFDKGQYLLGWYYESSDKKEEAIYWYEKAASLNNLDAMNNLGRCFLDGNELKTDQYEKGIAWLTKAAAKGHGNAQNNLGWWVKDPKQSFYWFLKAACQGFSCSQNNVAWCYQEGCGVEKNEALAVKWYKKAISKHNLFSKTHIGWCYQNGIGVKRNEKLAFKWYKRAARDDHGPAKEILGWCYWYGIGTCISYKKAIRVYESIEVKNTYPLPSLETVHQVEASYLNNKEDRFNSQSKNWWFGKEAENKVKSSDMYLMGIRKKLGLNGVQRNLEEAFRWFVVSASLGYELAQFEVGMCYKDGLGTPRDLIKAKCWFEKSYERRIYEAGKILKFFRVKKPKRRRFIRRSKEGEKEKEKGNKDEEEIQYKLKKRLIIKNIYKELKRIKSFITIRHDNCIYVN